MCADAGFVIVGGGLAGARAAEALRKEGFAGKITIVCEEIHRPYLRPPLSKEYLQGTAERDKVFVHPPTWYRDHDVEMLMGNAAVGLDRTGRLVTLADGAKVAYEKLLIATGSTPRKLDVPGAELAGVHYLRRIENCEAIRAAFGEASSVVIIGAGWIGLETAAAARLAGLEVTVLEAAELPLVPVLGRKIANVLVDLHRDHGVEFRFETKSRALSGDGGVVNAVELEDGTTIAADLVIVGVGITPNDSLAASAGIDVDSGIVVDEHLMSSDPAVFAAGDVARVYSATYGKHIRLEHWAAARFQPPVAAVGMMGGEAKYERLPYFYSDQYDLSLEYWGYAGPDDYDAVVVRGDLANRKFMAFWLGKNRVLAGMCVNSTDKSGRVNELIKSGREVDPARLTSPDVPLEDL
jgi:3-phenylpropionate/trans-cinnamate dioxygenase ferredoxin reductase subunit